MDVAHSVWREEAFDVQIKQRHVDVGTYAQKVLVLDLKSHPSKDNHGIPQDVISLRLRPDQATKLRDQLSVWLETEVLA